MEALRQEMRNIEGGDNPLFGRVLLEAIEAGSRTFLIDEDSSAVNFLIRDIRVRKLLGDDREPLIPLTDRIRAIAQAGYSFILVAGASGDYLDLADNIVVMANYKAECAKSTALAAANRECGEAATNLQLQSRAFAAYMQPLQKSVRPASAVERQVKVKLAGDTLLQIGFLVADTSRLNTLVDRQQRFGAGFMLLNLLQNAASNVDGDASADSVVGAAQKLCNVVCNVGFRNLPQGMSREMSLPRAVDIACVAFRLNAASRR